MDPDRVGRTRLCTAAAVEHPVLQAAGQGHDTLVSGIPGQEGAPGLEVGHGALLALTRKCLLLFLYGGDHLIGIQTQWPSQQHVVDRRGESLAVELPDPLPLQELSEPYTHGVTVTLGHAENGRLFGQRRHAYGDKNQGKKYFFHCNIRLVGKRTPIFRTSGLKHGMRFTDYTYDHKPRTAGVDNTGDRVIPGQAA